MDFDPRGKKWDCCCCRLPTGLQILATVEAVVAVIVAIIATIHVTTAVEKPSYFEICLILLMILLVITSGLLILGIHRHDVTLMYPTIAARLLLIIFVQVFGVSTVVAPQEVQTRWDRLQLEEEGKEVEKDQNVALRLVFLVFAMLFITVFVFYCIYLVVRCIQYERCFSRLKERRESFFHAAMIGKHFCFYNSQNLPAIARWAGPEQWAQGQGIFAYW
ncbi:unnamed protein product [Haemonchus placei]|uniref:G_PROTEIN_RECEP_F3_4 domain-containing protein n=1 Tax=Haemonchus placei TaxID=6290 RepID=A0A0N4X7P4_HAEPC|nr:unnamed protein product [Haemonchus placei]